MLKGIGYTLLAIAAVAMLALGLKAWRYYTAETTGKVDAHVQIESAPSRIGRYEAFFDQCAAIQGYESAISVQKASIADAPESDKPRIRQVIAGISAQRARAIAQYNADASKAYTDARFLDARLPKSISQEGSSTVCAI